MTWLASAMLLYVVLPAPVAIWLLRRGGNPFDEHEEVNSGSDLLHFAAAVLFPGMLFGHLISSLIANIVGVKLDPSLPLALLSVLLCTRARDVALSGQMRPDQSQEPASHRYRRYRGEKGRQSA